MVFLDSSVLVTVPSFDWVTVFSVDLTVPSLLTLLLLVLETSRSHPTSRNGQRQGGHRHAHYSHTIHNHSVSFEILLSFARAAMLRDGRQRTISAKLPPSKTLQVPRH